MSRSVNDVIDIMRKVLSRRNTNDPSSDFATLVRYINDFAVFTMPNISRLIEEYGTLQFDVDETVTNGVYTFNDVGATSNFTSISHTGYVDNNPLTIYQDPTQFYNKWDQFTTADIPTGMPIDMLYYGNEFVFRSIPDQAYTVRIFGYKQITEFPGTGTTAGDEKLPFDYWVRYIAYGAARNFAQDNNYDAERMNSIMAGFKREKYNMLARTHHQTKLNRSVPKF